jgi:DNA (cytosine-5)-methyltransferase 1
LNELSLFTGAGGGLLGTILLGWKHIGYVEKEPYCQRVIAQRIRDGILDDAPIFGDIRTFISEGYAERYSGMVDAITAGFPCQPFSVAGKRQGGGDARNMWPETRECIRIIRPKVAFLENVPGLFAHEYIQRIFGDLAEIGYDARWCVLGADDVGAPHRRKRAWIMAHDAKQLDGKYHPTSMQRQIQQSGIGSCSADVAYATSGELPGAWRKPERRNGIRPDGEDVADAEIITERSGLCPDEQTGDGNRRSCDGSCAVNMADPSSNGRTAQRENDREHDGAILDTDGQFISYAEKQGLEGEDATRDACADGRVMQYFGRHRWPVEPYVGRVAHGVASRVDRLKAIGNGQVPRVVACAWRILMDT